MTGEARMPTWKERENNKRRERRRRAVAARIFTGLRLNGNYKLSKHSNNNDVLKALCHEAGWTVEPDGTTYRKGSRPVENMDMMGTSVSASASPHTSYNPSPVSSSYAPSIITDGNSLIPWLRNLSSSSSSTTSSSSSSSVMHHYMCGGSISAPVTPPMSSPTAGTPRVEKSFYRPGWGPHPFLPLSMPPSPGRQKILPDFAFPTSQNFSLVSSNPFLFGVENLTSGSGGSLMCTPGQSGTCSPAVVEQTADIPIAQVIPNEFAFGSNMMGFVKPWEGEMIHEECGEEDLELTLGGSKAR